MEVSWHIYDQTADDEEKDPRYDRAGEKRGNPRNWCKAAPLCIWTRS